MADLSQKQPPEEQTPTPTKPASEKPPVDQPTDEPQPKDESSFPPMQDGDKPPTPEQKEIKEELEGLGVTPGDGSRKTKILMAALGIFLFVASLPAAVYLVQQRQEIRKEAAVGKKRHCTDPSCEVTVGPDNLSFTVAGHGTRTTLTPTINLDIPSDSTIYKAYALWGGERKANIAKDNSFKLAVNGGSSQEVIGNLSTYSGHVPEYDTYADTFMADITSLLPTNTTSFTFKVAGGFLQGGYNSDKGGGAGHGISIIIVYKNAANPYNKIKIKIWGEFVLRNTSVTMAFSLDELDTSETSSLKTGFFFGEGEGTRGQDRPNYLYYVENNNQQLDPTDGTPYPAYGSDPGQWWDTRITGDDLPAINAQGGQASFYVVSPRERDEPKGRLGDSLVWHGGIVGYPVTPPSEVLDCTSLTSPSAPSLLSPGAVISLTCEGTSGPNPIDHFEFRISIDEKEPIELASVEAEATLTNEEYQGEITYTIPDYACYKVECRACTSSDSSECTQWGLAQ